MSVYALIGVNMNGEKEVMGLYFGAAESTKYWLSVLTVASQEAGQEALSRFSEYPYILKSWQSNWEYLSTFWKYPR